ncbi:hypothetical protein N7541_000585 [Penicillium brevicompactum]|uniref:Uncharacterized protein n=1 Tax=Penicillium brevicompactum TaxID=5074 RepID=A0A9W9RWJ8_PENBR|nr:hypothetical protein N7541_000585 [Penicillium brevicompactum]
MSNKRQVFLSLHHRGALSLGESRQQLGYSAYHWGILISPKSSNGPDCYIFDVSNGIMTDKEGNFDLNPEGDWVFRDNSEVDPEWSGRVLGRVMIGKLPNDVPYAEIDSLLRSIPLPQKGALPEQNCVTWTRAAILKLRENNLVEQFDINRFMDDSLAFADERLKNTDSTPGKINYTGRRM